MTLGIAERPAADGADVLLELADRAGVDRPVSRIVHAWGDLVDQQPVIGELEQLGAFEQPVLDLLVFLRRELAQQIVVQGRRILALRLRRAVQVGWLEVDSGFSHDPRSLSPATL